MTSTVRRAGAFAVVGTLALVTPAATAAASPLVATVAATAPFVLVAVLALTVGPDWRLFDLFARPGDRQDGTLYGLAGFSLAAAGLALLTVQLGLPVHVFVGTVFVLSVGNLAANVIDGLTGEQALATGGFVVGGFLAGVLGQVAAATVVGAGPSTAFLAPAGFLAGTGALLGALLRSVLFERDDPLVMVSIGLLLWLLASLPVDYAPRPVVLALGVTAVLGYLSYALDTASIPGMLTGVLLALLIMVLGDLGWFAMLVAFFGLGGLSTKFRYEEKRVRGIAEPNDGARGSGNVLANSLVALAAVIGFAASHGQPDVPGSVFFYAFAGSIAAALGDTFSSEFGGLFDAPRLLTTLERVEPGTDGAVTWQGELAGLAGAGCIAGIGLGLFPMVGPTGALVIFLAGLAGMTADSLLGATVEGGRVGNQGVNLLATGAAALAAVGLAALAGLV